VFTSCHSMCVLLVGGLKGFLMACVCAPRRGVEGFALWCVCVLLVGGLKEVLNLGLWTPALVIYLLTKHFDHISWKCGARRWKNDGERMEERDFLRKLIETMIRVD
jgi:hypothetical protein